MEVGRQAQTEQERLRPPLPPSRKELLSRFIEANAQTLLQGLRVYVWRGRICHPSEVEDTVVEVLSEVVEEALKHADRFDLTRPAMGWLLGIGSNVIKRRREANAKRFKYEQVESDLLATWGGGDADGSYFDYVADALAPQAGAALEAGEQVRALLAQLSPEDQELLRLSAVLGLKGPELARRLGITPSNARVRLHRALIRLRQKLERSKKEEAGNA